MLVERLLGKENVMTPAIRKVIVLGLIGSILLLCNILLVANWLAEHGVVDWAGGARAEYLTGTAVTIIAVLLIMPVLLFCAAVTSLSGEQQTSERLFALPSPRGGVRPATIYIQ